MYKFALYHGSIGRIVLDDAPKGWDSFKLKFIRDQEYHGMGQKFTLDVQWITMGREFITSVYNQEGIQAKITAILYELNVNTNEYEEAYTGFLNLEKLVVSREEAQCNIEEGGFSKLLFTSEDIEIDLYASETLTGRSMPAAAPNQQILLHSKSIEEETQANVIDNQAEYQIIIDRRIGTVYIGFDDMKLNEVKAYNYQTGISFDERVDEFVEFKASGTVNVSFALSFHLKVTSETGDFDYGSFDWYAGLNNPERIFTHAASRIKETYEVTGSTKEFTASYQVKPGDRFYFYGRIAMREISGNYNFRYRLTPKLGTYVRINGSTTTGASTANGLMAHEAWAQAVNVITGRPDSFYSEFFGRTDSLPRKYVADGAGSLTWLTNGFQIRQFPLSERTVSTNFKSLFSSMNAIFNLGLGQEVINGKDVLRVEPKSYFYQDQVLLQLGMVKNLKKSVASNYFYNEAEFGYAKWQNNAQGTLDEFNTKSTRTLPIDVIKGKYSAVSKYIASGYTIESTRRQAYTDATTQDSSNDKEIFVVRLIRGLSGLEPMRNQGVVLQNIVSPETAYNVDISPTRNLFRHSYILAASLIYQKDKRLPLQPGDGNFKMSSQYEGEELPIVENMDIYGRDLEAPLWFPEFYEFDYPIKTAERKLIEANPYGIVTFMDEEGAIKKGYIIEVETTPYTKGTSWKLIRKFE